MDLDGVFDDDDGTAEVLNDLKNSTTEDVLVRVRLLENEIRVLRDESNRLQLDVGSERERVKDNMEKVKLNKQLPYLVASIVEILDLQPEDEDEEADAQADLDAQRSGKAVVLKTTTRQTIFLPIAGLVDAKDLKPSDLVGVNKDSYLILDTLPA